MMTMRFLFEILEEFGAADLRFCGIDLEGVMSIRD